MPSPAAKEFEELRPLLELCKAGRLFDVQDWIAQGKPITFAGSTPARGRRRLPLEVALQTGFHSMVQVLLEAGAPTSERGYVALQDAIDMRRPDLAELLLRHGADAGEVSLRDVIEQGCDPQLIDLLLRAGKNLIEDKPIAWGMINCIWPTLRLHKRHVGNCPELLSQVNLALRYHAKKGNAKWVSLTLWAGGDPLARGADDIDQDWDDESETGMNAVEVAAFYDRLDVLQDRKMLRAIRAAATDNEALIRACWASDGRVVDLFLRNGHSPQKMSDKGTHLIQRLVCDMPWQLTLQGLRSGGFCQGTGDCSGARQKLAILHMLVAHGARWLPQDRRAISYIRRSLLKLAPGFSMEFAWLMKSYGAARRADVRELLSTPTMRRHLSGESISLDRILTGIPEDPSPGPAAVEARAPENEQGRSVP